MKKIIVYTLLVLVVTSCFYTDGEQFESTIVSDYKPDVSFSSNLPPLDSLERLDSLFFSFDVTIDTGRLYYADLFFNNTWIFRTDTTIDSLWILPQDQLSNGLYDLTLVATYKSYTRSLADLLDAEPRYADTTWQIIIYSENELD